MTMRKFIIEIHPDGSLTCCEYEDPKDAARAANGRAWLEGYRQALIHCDDELSNLQYLRALVCRLILSTKGLSKYASTCVIFIKSCTISTCNKSKRPSGPSTGTARPVLIRQGAY